MKIQEAIDSGYAFKRRVHKEWMSRKQVVGKILIMSFDDITSDDWEINKPKKKEQAEAIKFFMALINAPIPKIAVENPISIMSTMYRKPDQIIQPWQFGHGETKATCLWLKNLPKLEPTNIVDGREPRVHRLPPSANRWKLRSVTYQGIADAMAEQWG